MQIKQSKTLLLRLINCTVITHIPPLHHFSITAKQRHLVFFQDNLTHILVTPYHLKRDEVSGLETEKSEA